MICFVLQGYGTPFEDNVSAIFHQMWILSIVHNFALFLQLPTLLEFLESRTPPTLLSPRLLPSCPSPLIFHLLEFVLGFHITANVTEKVYN